MPSDDATPEHVDKTYEQGQRQLSCTSTANLLHIGLAESTSAVAKTIVAK